MVNGPPKTESLGKFYPSLGISQNFIMGLRVSDLVSVGHIYAFLLSHYTFSSRARILRCQSWHLGESRILPFATPIIIILHCKIYRLYKKFFLSIITQVQKWHIQIMNQNEHFIKYLLSLMYQSCKTSIRIAI